MTRAVSKSKMNLCIRRTGFIFLILFVGVLQNTPHMFPTVFGAHAFLLIPTVVCIAMLERDLAATLMGIFAGAIWDATAARGDGFNALFLMIVATVVGLLINYLMRNNLSTALLLSSVAIVLYAFLHWFIFVICRGIEGGLLLFVTFYLPSIVYTFVFTPLFYVIMRKFLRKLRDRYPHKSRVIRPN